MAGEFDGFRKSLSDTALEEGIAKHCERFEIDPLQAAKHFPVLARRQWLKRFLAHTELFKKTLETPGDIAELGVFRGLGLMTWANLLECYCIGDRTKVVYGFDNWRGFGELSPEDGQVDSGVQKETGGFDCGQFREELDAAIALFDADRFIPQKPRITLIDGDIETSVPKFIQENPGVRFSLIHFDCDLYRPTKAALEALWPKLSRGGIMLFDEYAIREWPGETAAVDEFLDDKPGVIVKTLPRNNVPAGYIIKP